MPDKSWPTKRIAVASLHLDKKNPRLGRETSVSAPREIIQYLFENDKALEVADSIARRGYFPNEPLLAIKEADRLVVVEGNRRLAALKALREPGLLEGRLSGQVERLARRIADPRSMQTVPVTIAPSRRATDRQISGRHVGTPVLAWQAENRASFILDKLEEGYTQNELRDELGFSEADIQNARQTRAIADMARSLSLPEEIRAKLDAPRAKIFSTLERVFDSSVGRDYLKVEPDPRFGLRGKTNAPAFVRAFTKLVSDVALGKESSRTLNTNENIQRYFDSWSPSDLPSGKAGAFLPSDIITGRTTSSKGASEKKPAIRSARTSTKVLPRDFKVRVKNTRLIDIRDELVKLDRIQFTNAGAVLLRVFLELAVADYLRRSGHMDKLINRLGGSKKLRFETPPMKEMAKEIIRIAKAELKQSDADRVEKAMTYNPAAPFSISELHGFIHSSDIPTERDIAQFWDRTAPLFRLMLEDGVPGRKP